MTAPDDIHDLDRWLKGWLFDHALPLWWRVGADHERGGFHEKIGQDGVPVPANRPVRVAARQAWVYAMAGELGWTGPWREARDHALAALSGPFARADGLFRDRVSPDGVPVDETPRPYEQAFAILAFSGAGREAEAVRTREALFARMGRPDGGVHEDAARGYPLGANPLMHLFEAVLAWVEIGTDPGWRDLAGRIGDLALTRLIDPSTGALIETYGPDWSRPTDAEVWPGHQLEWGWILLWFARVMDRPAAEAPALRLIALSEAHGTRDEVVQFAVDQTLRPLTYPARLWSQIERLHAGLAVGGWDEALKAAAVIRRFLDVPTPGLWRDRLSPDGTFVDEPAPSSTLYHLISAARALDAVCGGRARRLSGNLGP